MTSPYFNTAEVAEYLRYVEPDGALNLIAARKWVYRHLEHGRDYTRRGSALLVRKEAIEAALMRRSS